MVSPMKIFYLPVNKYMSFCLSDVQHDPASTSRAVPGGYYTNVTVTTKETLSIR